MQFENLLVDIRIKANKFPLKGVSNGKKLRKIALKHCKESCIAWENKSKWLHLVKSLYKFVMRLQ